MDHGFRGYRQGLIKLDEIQFRRSREEFKVIIDPYASEAIGLIVPALLRNELAGYARSFYSLQQHIDAILAYDRVKLPEPTDADWNSTKQYTLSYFRTLPKVQAISYKDFDTVKWMPSSAAGFNYSGCKRDNDNYHKARRTAVTIAEKLDHNRSYVQEALTQSTPDIAFTRTQLSLIKVKTKVRNIWGEAFHYVLLEGLFADPLIQMFKELSTFYFIGKDPLFAVPLLIEDILGTKDYVYMFDWSGFDASVQEWEIRFAFYCLEQMLTFPSNVEYQVWSFVIELFIYRKIASPNGVLYLKTQGIPSGSCFTNIIGSIVNYVRIQYCFHCLTHDFADVYTHGDDSLAGVSAIQFVPLDRFATICEPLLWSINTLKTEVSSMEGGISFLSRSVREKQNTRDELTALRMLLYPEYEVTDPSLAIARAQSIAADAGIYSHYLYPIFEYLYTHHPHHDCTLPFTLLHWDDSEYEALRLSASTLV